jgi:hypothetical protein
MEGSTFFTESDNICLYGWWMDALESHTLMELDEIYLCGCGGSEGFGTGDITSFTLSVGTDEIVLTVIDTGGYIATNSATIVVSSFGFPDIVL